MGSIPKTVTIKGTNLAGTTVELEVPATSKKVTSSNNITSFERPKQNPVSGDARETRALNMNRIKVNIQTTGKVSDEFAAKNHDGTGDRPNLDNKEDWLNELWKLYLAQNILEFKAVNSDTYALTSEWSGYLHNADHQEKSQNGSSVYDMTLKFVDEVQMNS